MAQSNPEVQPIKKKLKSLLRTIQILTVAMITLTGIYVYTVIFSDSDEDNILFAGGAILLMFIIITLNKKRKAMVERIKEYH